MIQLLGNCFGQDASILYAGGACARAVPQMPDASKQALMKIETIFKHRLTLDIP